MKPFPGTIRKDFTIKCHPYNLTDDQVEWLREVFPVTENLTIIQQMGISYPTLYKLTKQYGLIKTEEGLTAIRKRKSDRQRMMFRLARLQLMGGQTPHRCTNVRIQPYTKHQINRRNRAVSRYGYIVKDGYQARDNDPERYIIYYDEQTQRSPTFEANCAIDGFQIKEL